LMQIKNKKAAQTGGNWVDSQIKRRNNSAH
jgi:hypothetical protein